MISAASARSRLRLGLPLVSWHYLPMLTAFQKLHPEIEFDMTFDNLKVDVIDEGLDVVLRAGDVGDPRLASHDLGSFQLYIVASPEYLTTRGRPTHPRDLASHDCIHYRMPHSGQLQVWPLNREEGDPIPVLPARLTCNNDAARLQFALDGLGLTCMAEYSVREHLEARRLEAVLEPFLTYRHTFRVLWPQDAAVSAELRTFIDFVIAWFTPTSMSRTQG